jgi:hypothetical protein
MQIAFTLPLSMLLLVPVAQYRLNLFYPVLMVLVGTHDLPLTFHYSMRIFLPRCAILVRGGTAIALYGPRGRFSLGGWGLHPLPLRLDRPRLGAARQTSRRTNLSKGEDPSD